MMENRKRARQSEEQVDACQNTCGYFSDHDFNLSVLVQGIHHYCIAFTEPSA